VRSLAVDADKWFRRDRRSENVNNFELGGDPVSWIGDSDKYVAGREV
jgi:hypothetical protein